MVPMLDLFDDDAATGKSIVMQGSLDAVWGGKTCGWAVPARRLDGGKWTVILRSPSRGWVGKVIWTTKKTRVVAHLTLVLRLKFSESITTMGIGCIPG